MKHYGIIGSGSCGENIIEDGLRDIGSEDVTYHIIAKSGPTSNEKRVYDFLLENELDYIAWEEGKAPAILLDNSVETKSVVNAQAGVLAQLRDNDGVLLLMWDSEDEETMYSICSKADADGIQILELTNGLKPISFVDNPEKSKSEEKTYELPVDLGTYRVKVTPEAPSKRPLLEAPEGECMVTVVMPNGTVVSTPATVEEVRALLGITGNS